MTDDWRVELESALTRAALTAGREAVVGAVSEFLAHEEGGPRHAAEIEGVPFPVLGLDACRRGWVGVVLHPTGRPTVHHGAAVAALLDQVRETTDVSLVAIDIPIGLPDKGIRQADVLARRELPGRGSSVFTTLTRAAYEASSYAEARAANIAATGGRSASAQAYALREKILEVDQWLRSSPGVEVIEIHPELSFARMAGRTLTLPKKDSDGIRLRRGALEAAGIAPPAWFRGSGFGEDDLLDACAAAWSAARHALGRSECLPTEPEVFSDGIPAAIHV